MSDALARRIGGAIGRRVRQLTPLSGGSTVAVLEAALDDGGTVVAKAGAKADGGHLALEAWMLSELVRRSDLPVPEVLHAEDDLLILSRLESEPGAPDSRAQAHAAELLAVFHGLDMGDRFGYARDTVIGQLPQPNPWEGRWLDFFREHRLLHMAREGHREGTVPGRLLARLEALAERLDQYLDEPAHPSLLHGDIWTGNVMHARGRITGFIDPAIYIGHPEIELAFATLFGTFGRPFFEAYGNLRPFDQAGFFRIRRDLYNIYPLLVHIRYWDTGYARPIEATLKRLGL